jgi:hypothetical protein
MSTINIADFADELRRYRRAVDALNNLPTPGPARQVIEAEEAFEASARTLARRVAELVGDGDMQAGGSVHISASGGSVAAGRIGGKLVVGDGQISIG